MKDEYGYSIGKRAAIDCLPPGKTRITVRLDSDVIECFRGQADAIGGGNYQSMINQALREYVFNQEQPLEEVFRRVVREESENYR